MNDQTRRVAAGIEKFLSEQISSGSLSEEKTESLQVALQCIQAVYGLDESPVDSVPSLEHLLAGCSVSDKASATLSAERKEEAEKLKNAGNAHMSAGRVALAIECYSKAIAIDSSNVIFYSNRAAAYQKEGKYDAAVKDCKAALAIDPAFVKAYTRLGAAYASQKKTNEAIEAYEKALELEPSNDVARAGLDNLTGGGSASPSGASPLGNMKMPGGMDLASLMNNPEMMAMAQNMMKSGAMDKMMRDPKMQKMMASMMGGMPPQADEEE